MFWKLASVLSELLVLFLGVGSLDDLEHIEEYCLNLGLHPPMVIMSLVCTFPKRGQADRYVLVVLLKAIILLDIVDIVLDHDSGPLHLHLGHITRQDLLSNRDVTSEEAFLVCLGALDGLLEHVELRLMLL